MSKKHVPNNMVKVKDPYEQIKQNIHSAKTDELKRMWEAVLAAAENRDKQNKTQK